VAAWFQPVDPPILRRVFLHAVRRA
jgi:hypothetical protein